MKYIIILLLFYFSQYLTVYLNGTWLNTYNINVNNSHYNN